MDKSAVKELIYGGINELMQNPKYYYHSAVGRGYCKWTAQGEQVLAEFISEISHLIAEAEAQALDQRAKELVVNELKG
jgi:hypothetical protein